jgi:chaperone modulatory protein CbpM
MADQQSSTIASEIVQQTAVYTLHELCISCDVNPDWVAGLVDQGAIEVSGQTQQEWQFTVLSTIRVAKAKRLERDLGLNLPGIALVLDLLDQLDDMRTRVRLLQRQPRKAPNTPPGTP